MKFGKRLRETVEKAPCEWKNLFVDYKGLKKLLKTEARDEQHRFPEGASGSAPARTLSACVEAPSAVEESTNRELAGGRVADHTRSPKQALKAEVAGASETALPGQDMRSGPQNKRSRLSTSPPLSSAADSDSDTDLSEAPPLELLEKVNKERIPRERDNHGFFDLLHRELDKVNDFFLEQLEDLIIRNEIIQREISKFLTDCKAQRSFCMSEIGNLSLRLKRLHDDLILLQNYAAVNYLGFRKALKKYDKKRGTKLRRTYLAGVLRTPFFLQSENLRSMVLEAERRLSLLNHLAVSQIGQDGDPKDPVALLPHTKLLAHDTPQTSVHGKALERTSHEKPDLLRKSDLPASPSRKNRQETAVQQF